MPRLGGRRSFVPGLVTVRRPEVPAVSPSARTSPERGQRDSFGVRVGLPQPAARADVIEGRTDAVPALPDDVQAGSSGLFHAGATPRPFEVNAVDGEARSLDGCFSHDAILGNAGPASTHTAMTS